MTNLASSYEVFTVCNLAYLPKARVLAASVLRHTGKKLHVFIFDSAVDLGEVGAEAEIHWIEDARVPHFHRYAFKYDIVELSTSLKPLLALRFLNEAAGVIFLDPDTCLFASLESIIHDLQECSILLTPHYTVPQADVEGERDLGMMRFGSFNLGFFAVRRTEEGVAFLNWWSERCLALSYFETQFGLSTDQKWVSIAPCFFRDIRVSFNLGYNAAPWNSYERRISSDNNGGFIVNDEVPLVFFHFSNFDPSDPSYLKKRSSRERGAARPDIERLGREYGQALIARGGDGPKPRYAYDFMSDGSYISPTLRRAYACVEQELPVDHDPFDALGPVGKFAVKNRLIERGGAFTATGFRDLQGHAGKLKHIHRLMRVVLRVVGPNRFYNLSRLLVYLSSYRQNRGLWKL